MLKKEDRQLVRFANAIAFYKARCETLQECLNTQIISKLEIGKICLDGDLIPPDFDLAFAVFRFNPKEKTSSSNSPEIPEPISESSETPLDKSDLISDLKKNPIVISISEAKEELKRLRGKRKSLMMSIHDLIKITGVKRSTLYRIEKGIEAAMSEFNADAKED